MGKYKFDSEAFIKELESMEGVEDAPLDYEDYELYREVEEMKERDLKGDI